MSVEFIAESLLRRARPLSPVLKDWISKILSDPTFCGPPLTDYRMFAAKKDRKVDDDAVHDLAKKLVDYREAGGHDKALTSEIMEYYDYMIFVGSKKAKKQAFGAHRFGRFNKFRKKK